MKKLTTVLLLLGFHCLTLLPLVTSAKPYKRRDPFRDLLIERESQEKTKKAGTPQFSIDEIVLTGITRARGNYIAIVNGPEGFPYFIKKGDKFSDGYVFTINETQVVFKKTSYNGIPLRRAKKIVKKL